VDVLVCTPGRLIDHLDGTANFTLQHLRYLVRVARPRPLPAPFYATAHEGGRMQVVDEADRLLNQSYQAWLDRVLAAADGSIMDASGDGPAGIGLRFHPDRPHEADSLRVPVRALATSGEGAAAARG
jgi:hypothetical protein